MKFLAISGSLRTTSTSTHLLRAAAELAPSGVTVTRYDGLDDLPHFSPDRDNDSPPTPVVHLRALLQEADAVLICTPEYIHGMPGVLKNMLDWVVSSGEFVNKPVSPISTSPSDMGGARAHESLVHTLEVMTAQLSEETSLIVPFVRMKIDANGTVIDSATIESLRKVMAALVGMVERNRFVTE